MDLVLVFVFFFIKSNVEVDVVDLMSELEIIEQIFKFVDENIYLRVCFYMVSMVNLFIYLDNEIFFCIVYDIYMQYKQYIQVMVFVICLYDFDFIKVDFDKVEDCVVKR